MARREGGGWGERHFAREANSGTKLGSAVGPVLFGVYLPLAGRISLGFRLRSSYGVTGAPTLKLRRDKSSLGLKMADVAIPILLHGGEALISINALHTDNLLAALLI
jgi:hypothetical protein